MIKKLLCYLLLMFSLYNYFLFFEWYLGDQQIIIEDALSLSVSSSLPLFLMILLIHIFYYPKQYSERANVITFPPIIMLLSANLGFTISTLNMYHFQVYNVPRFFDFLRSTELGIIFFFLSFIILSSALKEFRRNNEDPIPTTPSTLIIRRGIYGYSRNPMYLGLLFFQIGLGMLLSMTHIIFFSFFTYLIYNYYVIKPEELYLSKKFGKAYLDYKQQVRKWL